MELATLSHAASSDLEGLHDTLHLVLTVDVIIHYYYWLSDAGEFNTYVCPCLV